MVRAFLQITEIDDAAVQVVECSMTAVKTRMEVMHVSMDEVKDPIGASWTSNQFHELLQLVPVYFLASSY